MSIRKTLLSVALVGAFAVPAFAAGNVGYISERGEASYSGPMPGSVTNEMPSAKSRADVEREVLNARQNGTLTYVGDYSASWAVPKGGVAPIASAVTRESVRNDLKAFQRHPVTADGYRFVNGEIGYVYVGSSTIGQPNVQALTR